MICLVQILLSFVKKYYDIKIALHQGNTKPRYCDYKILLTKFSGINSVWVKCTYMLLQEMIHKIHFMCRNLLDCIRKS